jgi:hypothetical protein
LSSALAVHPEPAPVPKAPTPKLTNTALLAGTGGVLLLAPLAFGAVEPWAIFALEACAVLLLLAWGVRQWLNQQIDFSNNVLYVPMGAFLVLAVVQWITGATAYRHVTMPRSSSTPPMGCWHSSPRSRCDDPRILNGWQRS